jgi:uncharacterized damage-inducible protein DinB
MNAVALVQAEIGTSQAVVTALRARLAELTRLVAALPADTYRAHPSRVSGSIGEHVRHVLDHVSSLVAAGSSTVLSYDQRTRGTAVEADPEAAGHELLRLDAALESWSDRSLDEPIAVTALVASDGQAVTGWSTLARELAFVMSHTIHHQAIVALLLEQQGASQPNHRFGFAPSTPSPARR